MTPFLLISFVWFLALALDRVFGEPQRWHPLVGFGRVASGIDARFNRQGSAFVLHIAGLACWLVIVVPPVIAVYLVDYAIKQYSLVLSVLWHIVVLYWAVG